MFLSTTLKRNPSLVEAAFWLHQTGQIQPDTYLLDYDAMLSNGKAIKAASDSLGLGCYVMTKQFGRNPLVTKALMKLGFEGVVAVDFRDAQVMMQNGIRLGHVGNLVQPPVALLPALIRYGVTRITVFTLEKAREVGAAAQQLGVTQSVMLRVQDKDSLFYDGQQGGFDLEQLAALAPELKKIPGIAVQGVTSFPAMLYDETSNTIAPTPNFYTILKAKQILQACGFDILEVNAPSANCIASLPTIAQLGGTHIEPGHAFTGTTPFGACNQANELPALVYVSEISHNHHDKAYCYGGGHYRRSHMQSALVGKSLAESHEVTVSPPSANSIDYHFSLGQPEAISQTVVAAFRTQIFTTRSQVAVVGGIAEGKPQLMGLFSSQGAAL